MILIPRRWAQVEAGTRGAIDRASRQSPAGDTGVVAEFEAAVADYVGAGHAVAVNSGRQGMLACLRHYGVGPGCEVIVPAYTLASLIPLIAALGAKAVPADIAPDTLNVTENSVRARLSPRTRAILVLHAFGNPAPIDELARLGRDRGVAVIEDGAHALGARWQGRRVGAMGDAGFFSFEPTKPVNTFGGGMVVTNDAALAESIRAAESEKPFDYATLRKKVKAVHKEQWMVRTGLAWPLLQLLDWPPTRSVLSRLYRSAQSVPGGDYRYTPAQARLGMASLAGLDARLEARNAIAERYAAILGDAVALQHVADGAASTRYMLVARIPGGAAGMKRWLLRRGIDSAAGDEVADDCGELLDDPNCPEAARAYAAVLALPLYEGMPSSVIERVAKAVLRGLDRPNGNG